MMIPEHEFQSMLEIERAGLTLFSVCLNPLFRDQICPDRRISSRYPLFFASLKQGEFEKTRRSLSNKSKNHAGFRALVFVFAYPGETGGVNEGILDLVKENHIVIDATGVCMEEEVNDRYARNLVLYNWHNTRRDPTARAWLERAYGEMRGWTEKVAAAPVRVYDSNHPEGVVYDTLGAFYDGVLADTARTFPCSPDTLGLDNYFFQKAGARLKVKDGYYGRQVSPWEITDPQGTPERLFAPFWGKDNAWDDPAYAGEKVVILKKAFDTFVEARLEENGRVSFGEIFRALREPPYGLLPNYIGAILMGMFFRTWRAKGLIWSNGLQQEALDDAHLLAMVENGLQNQLNYYRNSLVDFIMLPGDGLARLREACFRLFGMDPQANRFLPDLRSSLRFALEKLPWPILSMGYAQVGEDEKAFLEQLLALARATSDLENRASEEALVEALNAALQGSDGLVDRLREHLTEGKLQEGFAAMLRRHGLEMGQCNEGLQALRARSPVWKWVWQEESIIREVRSRG